MNTLTVIVVILIIAIGETIGILLSSVITIALYHAFRKKLISIYVDFVKEAITEMSKSVDDTLDQKWSETFKTPDESDIDERIDICTKSN